MATLSRPVSLIKKSFHIFFDKKNLPYFLKIHSVQFLISIPYLKKFESGDSASIPIVLWAIIASILSFWTFAASLVSVKRVLAKKGLTFLSTYREAWGTLFKILVIGLILGLGAGLGIILLIIPGIMVMIYYSFSFYSSINGNGIKASLGESKKLVVGRFWKVFGRFLTFLVFSFLLQVSFSLVPYGVGTLIYQLFGALTTLPMYLLYKELIKTQVRET